MVNMAFRFPGRIPEPFKLTFRLLFHDTQLKLQPALPANAEILMVNIL
jgi:hypothetical protein